MDLKRRDFLKIIGLSTGSGLLGWVGTANAYVTKPDPHDSAAMLVDTTRCVGCRTCEMVCAEVNNLPEPALLGDESIFEQKRTTETYAHTVVNRYPNPTGEPVYVKTQCRHCNEPACASACLVKAMEKTPEGPVVYHEERCMGCRYCMVACPFYIPKFEWSKAVPAVRKCIFCFERQKEGLEPACAENCPAEALKFGKRKELLEIARTRIYQNPDQYIHHIYGEHEVGGTGWLYLSNIPFEQLGFRMDLGTRPYPEFTKGFLTAVPLVLLIWPALLGGVYAFTNQREQMNNTEKAVSPIKKEV